jgi:hypothetical protein
MLFIVVVLSVTFQLYNILNSRDLNENGQIEFGWKRYFMILFLLYFFPSIILFSLCLAIGK